MSYCLNGHTLGSCGCSISDPEWHETMSCLCSRASNVQSCCNSFVAYRINSGTIHDHSVESLILVRLIHDNEQASTLYLDDRADSKQQELLVATFTRHLGGILSDINSVIPFPRAVWLAPIGYQVDGSNRATLWIKNNLIWSGKPIPFRYQHDN